MSKGGMGAAGVFLTPCAFCLVALPASVRSHVIPWVLMGILAVVVLCALIAMSPPSDSGQN